MLSDAQWAKLDPFDVIKERSLRIINLRKDPSLWPKLKKFYMKNPAAFISDWCVTMDPRRKPALRPFILFRKQVEFIEFLHERFTNDEGALVEKSRDMGVTWLCCAFAVWRWLFFYDETVLFGSRKEALVDTLGDPDSIFEKMRVILKFLPQELLPHYVDKRGKHKIYDESTDALYMRLINRENGSVIKGEAGANIGRGGRARIAFCDEAAFYEQAEKITSALSNTTNCIIDVSTPNGEGNEFHRKRFGGHVPVFTLHWRDNPLKSQTWYNKQKTLFTTAQIARELDIDYAASIAGIAIPAAWVNAAVNAHITLGFEASGKKRAGLDVDSGSEDGDGCSLITAHGPVVQYLERWKGLLTDDTTTKAFNTCQMFGVEELQYDSIGVGAGVSATVAKIQKTKPHKMKIVGINVGSTHLPGEWEPADVSSGTPARKNKDMFANVKAHATWQLKRRFFKTWQYVTLGVQCPYDELISIPDDPELRMQLSQVRESENEAGKVVIETKQSLRKRGIKSPNDMDALVLLFYQPDSPRAGAW